MKRISALKKKYPHPESAGTAAYDSYCVGGALCLETGYNKYFPTPVDIRDALIKTGLDWYALPSQEQDEVWFKIGQLIGANDDGNFKLAWKTLGELLRYKRAE